MLRYYYFVLLFFIQGLCTAQTEKLDSLRRIGVCDFDGICIAKVKNGIRPKAFSIDQQRVLDYDLYTKFIDSSKSDISEISRNRSIQVKVKIPLILKPDMNIIMGFNYREEEFGFKGEKNLTNEFHKILRNRPLKSIGSTFYVDKKFKGRHYLFSRVGINFNGDYNQNLLVDYLRSSISVLYGTKVDSSKTWGYGLSYSYNFGQLAIYPILHYDKQLNKKWGFQMLLPVKTEFRYASSPKDLFYFTNQLAGQNYVLNFQEIDQDGLFFGKSHLVSSLSYERELFDFLWMHLSVGMQFNINFDVETDNRFLNSDRPFIENRLDPAPMIRYGFFIVPPRRWMKS